MWYNKVGREGPSSTKHNTTAHAPPHTLHSTSVHSNIVSAHCCSFCIHMLPSCQTPKRKSTYRETAEQRTTSKLPLTSIYPAWPQIHWPSTSNFPIHKTAFSPAKPWSQQKLWDWAVDVYTIWSRKIAYMFWHTGNPMHRVLTNLSQI